MNHVRAADLKVGDRLERIHVPTNSGSMLVGDVAEVETVVRDKHVYFKGFEYPFHDLSNFTLVNDNKESDMKVRAADEWQVGDMAYCLRGNDNDYGLSTGDIAKVIKVKVGGGLAIAGWAININCSSDFARILTPDEVRNLPAGAVVQHIRPSGYYRVGENYTIPSVNLPYTDDDTNLHLLYALVSLPENKQRDEAMKRIEAAEKELAEAKKMLEES